MNDNARRTVGAAANAVAASMVAGASAYALHKFGAPGEFVGLIAGGVTLAGGLSWITGRHTTLPKAYLTFRSISSICAASWLWWSSCSTPGPTGLKEGLVWGAGFIAAPFIGSWLAAPMETEPDTETVDTAPKKMCPEEVWGWRIMNICKIPNSLKQVAIRPWSTGSGYDVIVEFREGGYTIGQISKHLESLASDAGLPIDGGIDIRVGHTRRHFVLSVTTENSLGKEPLYFPLDTIGPRSVYDLVTVGAYGDRSSLTFANVRQNSIAAAGRNGAGKSGFLHNLIAHFGMCVDQLVWVIDLNSKGKLTFQWLYDWKKNGCKGKPPIDAVAGTVEEARLLIQFATEIALSRANDYADAIREAGDGDVPLSAKIPGIRIIIDEPKMIFAGRSAKHAELTEELRELQEVGRSVGIRPDWGVLGATQKSLPLAIKDQIVHRVVMDVADKAQMAYFLDWPAANAAEMSQLKNSPGKVYVGVQDTDTARLGRFYFIDMGEGKAMSKIAEFASTVRPDLDDAAKRLPGYRAYETRWDRWRAAQTVPTGESAESSDETSSSPVSSLGGEGSFLERLQARQAELEGQRVETQAPPKVEYQPRADPEVDPFDLIVQETIKENADMKADPIKVAVVKYLIEQGASRTGDVISYLENGVTTLARPTLAGKLAAYAESGVIENPSRGWWKLPD